MTVIDRARRYREFKLPDVGEGLTEAEILKWHVQVGDAVTDGQVVVEIETVKSAVELPIPTPAWCTNCWWPRVRRWQCRRRSSPWTPTRTVRLRPTNQADLPVSTEPAPPKREPVLVGYGIAHSSSTPRPRRGMPTKSTGVRTVATPASSPGRPAAKPPVRKLAKDLGVDLARIQPTGPDGIITRSDVEAAASAAMTSRVTADPVSPEAAGAGELRSPIEGVRKAIAEAMVKSAFTAPHVTEFVTVDVTRSMRLLQDLKQDREFAQIRVSPLLLVAKALLVAIRRIPRSTRPGTRRTSRSCRRKRSTSA